MLNLTVYYIHGQAGFEHDDTIRKIVGSKEVSCGTWIPTGERDMEFNVKEDNINKIVDQLKANNFRTEVTSRPESI